MCYERNCTDRNHAAKVHDGSEQKRVCAAGTYASQEVAGSPNSDGGQTISCRNVLGGDCHGIVRLARRKQVQPKRSPTRQFPWRRDLSRLAPESRRRSQQALSRDRLRPSFPSHQLPEHVLQNPAVRVVQSLLGSVDANYRLKIRRLSTRYANGKFSAGRKFLDHVAYARNLKYLFAGQ